MHFATNRKPFCSDQKRILTNRKPILTFIPRSPASVTADRPDGCKRGRAGADYLVSNDKHLLALSTLTFPPIRVVTLDQFKEIVYPE